MILSCPACATRYVVPDSAVGPKGRQVRCAACKTSWFQEPAQTAVREPEMAMAGEASPPRIAEAPAEAAIPAAAPVEATAAEPAAEPPPQPPAEPPPPPVFEEREPPQPARPNRDFIGPEPSADAAEEGYDAFAHEPPFRPRRNPARMWTIIAVVAALLMLSAAAAVYYFGVPTIGGSAAMAQPNTPLVIELTRKPERRMMESGNELFALSGRILNPTDEVQRVPQIQALLRDTQGRVVYDWAISAPVSELQPGQSASFNSAEVDVPRTAHSLSVRFGRLADPA